MAEEIALGAAERQWRATILLGWPLALGAAPLLVSQGAPVLCLFRQLSGQPCPLCGGTHACAALISGDLGAAWQANPGLLPVLAVAAVHTVFLATEALTGRRLGTPRWLSWAWAGSGAALLGAWGLRLFGLAA